MGKCAVCEAEQERVVCLDCTKQWLVDDLERLIGRMKRLRDQSMISQKTIDIAEDMLELMK